MQMRFLMQLHPEGELQRIFGVVRLCTTASAIPISVYPSNPGDSSVSSSEQQFVCLG